MGRQHCHETNGLQAAREQSVEFIQNRCAIGDLNASSVVIPVKLHSVDYKTKDRTEIAVSERLEVQSPG